MKFVIVIDRLVDLNGNGLTIGGIQTYLQNLSQVINKKFGIKPIVYQKANKPFILEYSDFIVKGFSGIKDSRMLFENIEKEYEPDETIIIWGSDQYSVRQKKYKTISIQHGIGFDMEASESKLRSLLIKIGFKSAYKFLQRYNARKLARNSQHVVCVDYNFYNWIRTYNLSSSENYIVIPNFTDVKEININQSKKKSIIVARRFVKRRGINLAVNVAKRLMASDKEVTFTFAGEGPEIKSIEKLIEEYPGRVEIITFNADESLDVHKNFEIALIPSLGSEGTSLSLLESMASGCIPVATSIGGMTNIVIDRFNGFLVAPKEEELLETLKFILSDDNSVESISNAAYLTAKFGFNKSIWAEKWLNVLNKVIAENE
jgi:glycosyltransferase involved in cell wall biosynthesis